MNENVRHAGRVRRIREGDQMLVMAVHSSVRNQPEKMEAMSASFREGFLRDGIPLQLAVGEGFVDSGKILVNDPTRAEIQVADLRVAHLPFRQPNVETAGAQPSARVIAIEAVVKWRPRQQRRIAIFFALLAAARIDSPTVANNENDRPRHEGSFATLVKTDKWFPGCGLTRAGADS